VYCVLSLFVLIRFQILDTGKWAYVNQTKKHSRLHFFDANVRNQSGSLVLMPLKRFDSQYANGLLGIDTIRDGKDKAFVQHEIQFYEGIASTLSDKLTLINFHSNIMKVIRRFIYWISQRCSHVRHDH
jgi:hypothetical protein